MAEPQSRNEAILTAIIDGVEYTAPPQSRIEALLIELKAAIEESGGIEIDTQVNETSENPVQNKAIYSYVNSSVATNTAYFRGTFNSVADLEAYSGELTNNDYAFVTGTDSAGNTYYDRYKYDGTEWVFEYELNNSSFTAAQWATIQSGLTAADKTQIGTNRTNIENLQSQTSTNTNNIATNTSDIAALQNDVDDLEAAMPTVDQTYSATSTNAQSGAAVAQALASGKGYIGDVEVSVKRTNLSSQLNEFSTQPQAYIVYTNEISLKSNLVEAGGLYALVDSYNGIRGISFYVVSGKLSVVKWNSNWHGYSAEPPDATKVGYTATKTETLKLYRIA